ncbi:MAG: hypothetical protein ACYC27_15610 [Armatimonadota bacterium]
MKKLISVSLFLIVAASIAFIKLSDKREIIWVCPKGETISYIQTAEKPGKLYVETEKGHSRVFRAVYGPDNVEVLLTIPGKGYALIHPIQGYNPDEFLIYSFDGKSDKQYIHNIKTGKDTDIKRIKGISLSGMKQSISLDGKWLVKGGYTKDKKVPYIVNIIDRQSGSFTPLRGIDTSHSNELTWTPRGLMVFNNESGTLYKGDENGVKPIKQVGRSPLGFVTPDGDELIALKLIENHGISLKSYNLNNNKSHVIYKGYSRPSKKELDALCLDTWFNSQYSMYSDEMTVSMNWPPGRPVYIGKNRRGKEIPIRSKNDLLKSYYGVAIWKPGIVAYAKGPYKKRPNVILSVKMN